MAEEKSEVEQPKTEVTKTIKYFQNTKILLVGSSFTIFLGFIIIYSYLNEYGMLHEMIFIISDSNYLTLIAVSAVTILTFLYFSLVAAPLNINLDKEAQGFSTLRKGFYRIIIFFYSFITITLLLLNHYGKFNLDKLQDRTITLIMVFIHFLCLILFVFVDKYLQIFYRIKKIKQFAIKLLYLFKPVSLLKLVNLLKSTSPLKLFSLLKLASTSTYKFIYHIRCNSFIKKSSKYFFLLLSISVFQFIFYMFWVSFYPKTESDSFYLILIFNFMYSILLSFMYLPSKSNINGKGIVKIEYLYVFILLIFSIFSHQNHIFSNYTMRFFRLGDYYASIELLYDKKYDVLRDNFKKPCTKQDDLISNGSVCRNNQTFHGVHIILSSPNKLYFKLLNDPNMYVIPQNDFINQCNYSPKKPGKDFQHAKNFKNHC